MKTFIITIILSLFASLALCLTLRRETVHIVPTINSTHIADDSPIQYHYGGAVMTNPVNVYFIYYGDFSDQERDVLETFMSGFQTSDWWQITKKYYYQADQNSDRNYVDGGLTLAGTYNAPMNYGNSLNGDNIIAVVRDAVSSGSFPSDSNGIYAVLSGDGVSVDGFCSQFCGYHYFGNLDDGSQVTYAFVGKPWQCINGCTSSSNFQVSPNNSPLADSMISSLAHEILETVTDPLVNAWNDQNGYENADKCAYNYGETGQTDNGAAYNVQFGDRSYLLQQNWDPERQTCALSP